MLLPNTPEYLWWLSFSLFNVFLAILDELSDLNKWYNAKAIKMAPTTQPTAMKTTPSGPELVRIYGLLSLGGTVTEGVEKVSEDDVEEITGIPLVETEGMSDLLNKVTVVGVAVMVSISEVIEVDVV